MKKAYIVRTPREDGTDSMVFLHDAQTHDRLLTLNEDACFVGKNSLKKLNDKEIISKFLEGYE